MNIIMVMKSVLCSSLSGSLHELNPFQKVLWLACLSELLLANARSSYVLVSFILSWNVFWVNHMLLPRNWWRHDHNRAAMHWHTKQSIFIKNLMLSDELVLLVWKPRASAVVFDTAGTVVLGVATKDASVYQIVFFVR